MRRKRIVPSTRVNVPALALLALSTAVAIASTEAAAPTDKSGYTLLNPTPRQLMREMSTDRPDKTESPYTVDAGHLQLEMDLFSYTYDRERDGGVTMRVDAWAIAPINVKIGLCNRVDLQVIAETWNYARTTTGGAGSDVKAHQRGFGDVTTRIKYNLWGNDGGKTAFAGMPFVKWPTNQDDLGNDSVEGGIIFPLAAELPRGLGMGVMTEFDWNRDGDGDGRHAEFINSITFSRDLVGYLGGYVEFFSLVSAERDSDWVGTVDTGMTYGLTENVQLDAGVNVGVTESADDVNPFAGLSWRF